MKKKLLLFILPMLLFTVTIQAQQTWDFSTFADQAELTTTTVISGLTMEPGGGSGFGIIESNGHSFPDGFSSAKRFKGGGNSSSTSTTLPTRRYLTFDVAGDTRIKVWARASGTSLPRALSIMDASANEIGHYDSTGSTDGFILEADYIGPATTIYIHFIDNAFNLYKIVEDASLLGVNDLSSISTKIRAIGDRIYVSNVKTQTEVNIYSMTGKLVKSFETNEDVDFSFGRTGLFIANVKTEEGQKSFKIVTH